MIYSTADTHFGYANAVIMCDRPYPDVESMNEASRTFFKPRGFYPENPSAKILQRSDTP